MQVLLFFSILGTKNVCSYTKTMVNECISSFNTSIDFVDNDITNELL